jgi:hypothetical protein
LLVLRHQDPATKKFSSYFPNSLRRGILGSSL